MLIYAVLPGPPSTVCDLGATTSSIKVLLRCQLPSHWSAGAWIIVSQPGYVSSEPGRPPVLFDALSD